MVDCSSMGQEARSVDFAHITDLISYQVCEEGNLWVLWVPIQVDVVLENNLEALRAHVDAIGFDSRPAHAVGRTGPIERMVATHRAGAAPGGKIAGAWDLVGG